MSYNDDCAYTGHTEYGWCRGNGTGRYRLGKAGLCTPYRNPCLYSVEAWQWCERDETFFIEWSDEPSICLSGLEYLFFCLVRGMDLPNPELYDYFWDVPFPEKEKARLMLWAQTVPFRTRLRHPELCEKPTWAALEEASNRWRWYVSKSPEE